MTQESPENQESQTPDGAEPITDPRATPLWDPTLPIDERVDWLLGEMTIDEKLGFLATTTPDLPRLGITRCWIGGEAAHGVEARHDQGANPTAPETTTSLPQPIGMAATWDAPLLEEAGEVVGKEARTLWHRDPRGGLFRWAPTVDLERDPRWGRNEEGYGEDPHLTGAIETSEAATDGTDAAADRTLRVRVDIVNEGTRSSDEVVQVYVRHPHERVAGADGTALAVPPIAMPERRLVAFRRERSVEPGERRTIEFTIPREELRVYDVRKGGFRIPDGEYTIEAGASSGDIRATTTVRVDGEPPVMRRFDEWIPVDHWDRSDGVALVAAAGRASDDEPLASLVAAGEACAATTREPSRPGVMRFDGFSPFSAGAVVRIAADSIDGDGAVQEVTLPLPEGETGFTMAIGDGDIVRAVRCEVRWPER